MLVQPTEVAPGGAAGHNLSVSEVPAPVVELVNLRNGLATGAVAITEAVSRLLRLLVPASDSCTEIRLSELCDNPNNPNCGCTVCAALQATEQPWLVHAPTSAVPAAGRFAFPRWTFGGYCTMCYTYACQDPRCDEDAARFTWALCPDCKGSTYKDIDHNTNGEVYDLCTNCTFGAVEVASVERGRP